MTRHGLWTKQRSRLAMDARYETVKEDLRSYVKHICEILARKLGVDDADERRTIVRETVKALWNDTTFQRKVISRQQVCGGYPNLTGDLQLRQQHDISPRFKCIHVPPPPQGNLRQHTNENGTVTLVDPDLSRLMLSTDNPFRVWLHKYGYAKLKL